MMSLLLTAAIKFFAHPPLFGEALIISVFFFNLDNTDRCLLLPEGVDRNTLAGRNTIQALLRFSWLLVGLYVLITSLISH
jgi:hypothetical protein